MEPVDHYEFWHQLETRPSDLLDRERIHLELLGPHLQPGASVLDAGCGDGRFLDLLNRRGRDLKLIGADYSRLPLEAASKLGFEVHRANFEAALPFEDEQFDVINAAQVVEHLYNPDLFVRELRRVLRHDGHLVLSTPNLCAWFNRILVPFGVQPIFYESSTESTVVGAGMLRRFKRGDRPVGHVRLFTLLALSDILKRTGFSIVKTRGALFDEGLPPRLLPVDRAFARRPSLASLLVVLARPTA